MQIRKSRSIEFHWLIRIEIDKDPPMFCGVGVDLKKTVFGPLKPRHTIKLRCLDQVSDGVIAPAMILTAEHCRCACLLSSNGICAMATNIMECADLAILSADQENREPGEVKGLISPRLNDLGDMAEIYP